jgi:peptidoglycan/xylan/chitin deacetylase (PgdA/CDA1 family)
MKSIHGLVSVWMVLVALVGCARQPLDTIGAAPAAASESASHAVPEAVPPVARVSERPANIEGRVFIVEYHKISKEEARWDRSIDRFRNDLERLYRMGFRPVTLTEYLDDRMDLPPGASPVVFTFDDAHASQFRLLDSGSIDPESAVGIWLDFARRHPDFPVKASFYVLPDVMWSQPRHLERKLALLKEWGSELGSHTMSHTSLARLSDEGVKRELAEAIEFLAGLGFGDDVSIALPYGISPKNRSLLERFEWNGREYAMRGALLVGANPAPAPSSPDFDRFRIPRIQGIEGDFGITFWLDKVERGDVQVYVAP